MQDCKQHTRQQRLHGSRKNENFCFFDFSLFLQGHMRAKIKVFFDFFFCSPTHFERRRILVYNHCYGLQFSQPFTDSPLRNRRSVDDSVAAIESRQSVGASERLLSAVALGPFGSSGRPPLRYSAVVRVSGGPGANGSGARWEQKESASRQLRRERTHTTEGRVTTERSSASQGGPHTTSSARKAAVDERPTRVGGARRCRL